MPTNRLSAKARVVLAGIAQGRRYEQILAANPDLTYLDIFAAAAEALALAGEGEATYYAVGDGEEQAAQDDERAFDVEAIRRSYARAYEKWTEDEDERLREAFAAGASEAELADLLRRQPGAIRSRLTKLGLQA